MNEYDLDKLKLQSTIREVTVEWTSCSNLLMAEGWNSSHDWKKESQQREKYLVKVTGPSRPCKSDVTRGILLFEVHMKGAMLHCMGTGNSNSFRTRLFCGLGWIFGILSYCWLRALWISSVYGLSCCPACNILIAPDKELSFPPEYT